MVSQDQAERNEYKQFVQSKAGGDWNKGAQMYAQLKGRPSDDIFGDSANQDRFMKMTFDFDTFTQDDWHNYWLMAQHCDKNRDFQRQALAAIEKYQGQDHQNYHYLADRISCGTTGTQKYGTQDGCNIDSVNENFADGRHPEDKGEDIRVWEQTNVAEAKTHHHDHEFKTAYHITSTENAEEILYAGLDPYDGKAFMVVDEGDKGKLQKQLSVVGGWMYAKSEGSDDPLTLLQIDVTGIPLTYDHGWYFSTTKISPDRIQDLGEDELARYV